MILESKKYSVLVVSSSEKMNESFKGFLPSTRYSGVTYAASVAAAKRAMLDKNYDFVIVNTPLKDDFGLEFAVDVCSKTGAACLIMVKAELYEKINYQVTKFGVFTLPKPVSSSTMEQALRWLAPARERVARMEKKTDTIEGKMNEIRIVNRAKWLLIENLSMSESEAHRYIEKRAMDSCTSKLSVAEEILKTYQK